ncbi:hypothetical protein D3C72_1131110 [compost metagenome]
MRHVLANLAIPARGGLHQQAVFVAQVHRETIELGLGHIFHRWGRSIQPQFLADARIESLGSTGLVVCFGADAEHGHRVAHRRQAVEHRANHPLGGRIGCHQFGVCLLQCFQLLVDAVVFAIGHARRVEHIVFVRPADQLVA